MWGALPKTLRLTDKKANEIFLKYKEIQMLKYFTRYKEAAIVIYGFATDPFWISLYNEELIFYLSVR